MRILPSIVHTTYQQLLEKHLHRPTCLFEGSIISTQKNGKRYWVARQRIGEKVKETQIGPDNSETRALVEKTKEQQSLLDRWRDGCQTLVSQLRAAGVPTTDMASGKLLSAFSRNGLFKAGAILTGTHAFRLYMPELGCLFTETLFATQDVDITADKHVRIASDHDLSIVGTMDTLGMTPVVGVGDEHPVKWISEDGLELDLLTPRGRSRDAIVKHEGLQAWAQPLAYLEYLIESPIHAVALYREGILVNVPSPERFAIHKLIVASVRAGAHQGKAHKDRDQSANLIEVLAESRPGDLKAAYADATSRGKQWRKAIDESLGLMPRSTEILSDL